MYYAIQGSALILHVRILVARVYIGKYLQLQHAVSIPEKISICLNRGHEEFMDDYYTLRAEATSIFFLQLKLVCSSACRSAAQTAKM